MAALLTKSLGVICPSCEFLNVVAAVRCMSCGVATDGDPAPAPSSSPSGVAKVESSWGDAAGGSASENTQPGVSAPPGLRRSTGSNPALAQSPAPSSPSGVRPVFQSSASSIGAAPKTAEASSTGPKFGLTVLAGPARGQRFRLGAGGAQVGRSKGVILFSEDPFVSPLHATLSVRDGKLFVRDESSTSGVYVSVNGQETIPPGGAFSTGLRLFRYVGAIEPIPPWNRTDVLIYGAPLPNGLVHYAFEEVLLGDRSGRCIATPGPVLTIGQGKCDFSFPTDEGLAPRHCEVAPMPTGAMIRDLSGGLGTFVKVAGERALKAGDRLRIGQQTLQVESV